MQIKRAPFLADNLSFKSEYTKMRVQENLLCVCMYMVLYYFKNIYLVKRRVISLIFCPTFFPRHNGFLVNVFILPSSPFLHHLPWTTDYSIFSLILRLLFSLLFHKKKKLLEQTLLTSCHGIDKCGRNYALSCLSSVFYKVGGVHSLRPDLASLSRIHFSTDLSVSPLAFEHTQDYPIS